MDFIVDRKIFTVGLNDSDWTNPAIYIGENMGIRIYASGGGGWRGGIGGEPNPATSYVFSAPEGTKSVQFGGIPSAVDAPTYGWYTEPYPVFDEDFTGLRTVGDIGVGFGWVAPHLRPMSLMAAIRNGAAPGLNFNNAPDALQVNRHLYLEPGTAPRGWLYLAFNDIGVSLAQDNFGHFNIIVEVIVRSEVGEIPEIDEIELDREIAREANGGPMGQTTILQAGNAREQRNSDWEFPRQVWNIIWATRTSEDKFKNLIKFFHGRRWRSYGFRFYDWADHDDWNNGIITWNPNTQKYQMFKVYDDPIRPMIKPIYKPIEGTITVYSNDVPVADPPLEYTTGQFGWAEGAAPPNLTWTGEFCLPVRFDTDKMEYKITPDEAVIWSGVPVIELI